MCTGALPRTETVKILADLGWPLLSARRKHFKLILMYKIINKLPPNIYLMITWKHKILTPRHLRMTNRITIPFSRTIKHRNSFFPSTLKLWNELASNLADSPSLNTFKNALYNYPCHVSNHRVFNSLNGFYASMLTQIRLGLSNLRSQLFNYFLCDNPFCPLCFDAFESSFLS